MRLATLLASLGVAACAHGAPRPASTGDDQATLAVVDATVLPMHSAAEQAAEHQTVLIRDGRIVAVGPVGRVAIPAGAERVDGRGKWLMPGLVDMHTHFMRPDDAMERDLPLYLANGVTTVRNMRGTSAHLALRDRVARGELVGPTIYTVGQYAERFPDSIPVEAIVRGQKEAGYDFVKVHDHGLPRARYEALAQSARAQGMPLIGHVPMEVGVETAVRHGHQTIEHVENLMQTFFDMKLETARFPELVTALRGSRTCVVPTLVVFEYVTRHSEQFPQLSALVARPELRYVRPGLRAGWMPPVNSYVRRLQRDSAQMPTIAARTRAQMNFMRAMTGALHAGGIPLAAGSDAGIAFTLPGYSLVEELELMRGAGLTPYQALRSATHTAAQCMSKETEFGTVRSGMRADLLLLDRDPRADLTTLGDPAAVVLRGRLLTRADLRQMLGSVESRE